MTRNLALSGWSKRSPGCRAHDCAYASFGLLACDHPGPRGRGANAL